MLSAKDISDRKIQTVKAHDLRPGDYVFYIGRSAARGFIESLATAIKRDSFGYSDSGKLLVKVQGLDRPIRVDPHWGVMCVQLERQG